MSTTTEEAALGWHHPSLYLNRFAERGRKTCSSACASYPRSSRFASARTAALAASSHQARRSASRLTFTHSSHRARRARAHASIRRSSSCAFLGYEKRAKPSHKIIAASVPSAPNTSPISEPAVGTSRKSRSAIIGSTTKIAPTDIATMIQILLRYM